MNDSTTQANKEVAFYAILTPPGRGAVAVILASSPNIEGDLAELFHPVSGRPISECWNQPIVYGQWRRDSGAGEDLVVCPKNASNAEIHCHGGDSAVSAITNALRQRGYREATSTELANIQGLSQWEQDVKEALKLATTERCSLILLSLLETIDATIYSLAGQILNEPDDAIKQFEQALANQAFGLHLTKPWSVVLCGVPNVGKSSLINAIVGFDRTIVHDVAGTTRDVVSQMTAIDGWPTELKDTAGLRSTVDVVEVQGVEKARQEIEQADLVVHVLDASNLTDSTSSTIDHRNLLTVFNKIDQCESLPEPHETIFTSAVTGQGIDNLISSIGKCLVKHVPNSELLPINEQQVATFNEVLNLILDDKLAQAAELLTDPG